MSTSGSYARASVCRVDRHHVALALTVFLAGSVTARAQTPPETGQSPAGAQVSLDDVRRLLDEQRIDGDFTPRGPTVPARAVFVSL